MTNSALPHSTPSVSVSVSAFPPSQIQQQEDKIALLQAELESLRTRLGPLDAREIVQTHIHLLHTYNEVKDASQSLIGKYALLTERTIKDVHQELELPLGD